MDESNPCATLVHSRGLTHWCLWRKTLLHLPPFPLKFPVVLILNAGACYCDKTAKCHKCLQSQQICVSGLWIVDTTDIILYRYWPSHASDSYRCERFRWKRKSVVRTYVSRFPVMGYCVYVSTAKGIKKVVENGVDEKETWEYGMMLYMTHRKLSLVVKFRLAVNMSQIA